MKMKNPGTPRRSTQTGLSVTVAHKAALLVQTMGRLSYASGGMRKGKISSLPLPQLSGTDLGVSHR